MQVEPENAEFITRLWLGFQEIVSDQNPSYEKECIHGQMRIPKIRWIPFTSPLKWIKHVKSHKWMRLYLYCLVVCYVEDRYLIDDKSVEQDDPKCAQYSHPIQKWDLSGLLVHVKYLLTVTVNWKCQQNWADWLYNKLIVTLKSWLTCKYL